MGVFKKENRWYMDYYLPGGKRKREVVTIKGVSPERITRQDAIKTLDIRRGQLASGKFEIAGSGKFTFHDLRHTLASILVMKGVDLATIQELLGYKSILMIKRYSHPTLEHKKQAVEKLSDNYEIGGSSKTSVLTAS